jgi:hypothetical protein
MKHDRIPTFCALGLGLLTLGCNRAPESGVLATVQDEPVTEAAFRHGWDTDTPSEDSPATREALLDKLVRRQMLVQRARTAGLDQDPVVVEAIESLLIARLKETELHPQIGSIEISEDETRAFYERHQADRYTLPERVRMAVLWFDSRGQEPLVERYRPRMEQVREELMKDPASIPHAEGFGPLSARNTEHRGSRYRGGDVGWMEIGPSLDPWRNALLEVAAPLTEPGQLSQVVVRPEGLFLVRLVERQPARVRAIAEVRSAIEQRLKAERRSEREGRFYQEIAREVAVRTYPDRLSALDGLPAPVVARTDVPPMYPALESQP